MFVAPVRTAVIVIVPTPSATFVVPCRNATLAASSSVIVTVFVAVAKVVFVGLINRTWKVSEDS